MGKVDFKFHQIAMICSALIRSVGTHVEYERKQLGNSSNTKTYNKDHLYRFLSMLWYGI